MKAKCFISYSHEDVDRDTLDYLIFLLETHSDNRYEVLVDEKLDYGDDLQDFMERLDNDVNAVLILLTPSYKRKVLERQGGVYEEYRRIIARHQTVQDQKRQGKKSGEIEGYFVLIPVLFSGTFESSMTDELRRLKALDLVGLHVIKDHDENFSIPQYVARRYIPEILRVVSNLEVVTTLKSKDFEALYAEYFKRLFLELKADWANPRDDHHHYIKALFVKTFSYKKVQNQAVYFLIGRKGSGKTTITDAMALRNRDRYVGSISIVADEFNLEVPYYLLNTDRLRADMESTFPRHRCFEYAWEAFIFLCCIELLVTAADDHELTSYQTELIEPLRDFRDKIQRDADTKISAPTNFVYCFSSMTRFLEHCVSESRSEEEFFFSDLSAIFSRESFLNFVYPAEVQESLLAILSTLRKKFLVTLDGFDSAFDRFRRDSLFSREALNIKAHFELDWLRSLLHLVMRIKRGGEASGALSDKAEFCITVPQDRFYEVKETERDSFRFHGRFCELKWSGIELAILLRKRLEELTQRSTDRLKKPEDRLEQIMREAFPHIPTEVSFVFNGKNVTMPLFMYVLRHTFWRPRDILLYYAQIIAVAESLRKKGSSLSTEVARQTIKDVTKSVIRSEFVNEFDSTIINIDKILDAFRGSSQILAYHELGERLARLDFSFAVGTSEELKTEPKVDLLYRIGFLGVLADDSLRSRLNLKSAHAFYFNEGDTPVSRPGYSGLKEYIFIIHPIFSEYLELDTSENELIMQPTWRYLHETEALLFA